MDVHAAGHVWIDMLLDMYGWTCMLSEMYGWTCCRTCMDGHAVGHVWMDMLSDMYGWTCCRTCMDEHAVGHVWTSWKANVKRALFIAEHLHAAVLLQHLILSSPTDLMEPNSPPH